MLILSLSIEEYEKIIWETKEKRMEIGGTNGSDSRRSDKTTVEGKQNKQEN